MLSLGPGSACDVCLEPFSADLKAPCSIPCGHVFCVNCLQQVERPTCPLCRKPFNERHMIKLHVDLDTLRTSASSDEHTVSSNTDEDARRLQDRITLLATNGATETQTTQLTEECKAFLATVPKTMYADLRTSVKMLIYICHVKHLYFDQQRLANQLTSKCTTLTQEVDRLKAAVEVLKIEKRRLEQAYQSVSDERDEMSTENDKLHEQLENAEAQVFLVTEWNETAQNQLVLLNEELQRLRSEAEFSSPEGDSPADIPDFPSNLPPSISPVQQWPRAPLELDCDSDNHDPSAPFLTPWGEFTEQKTLPDADSHEELEHRQIECTMTKRTYCGAAGCPHSCDCVPFLLFSPGSQQAAARAAGGRTISGLMHSPAASGLSLSFRQPRSRSHSRPRSRSLSRAPSPAYSSTSNPPRASPIPTMSMSINIPNHHHALRGQLLDLLTDPPVSSSLPNMPPTHFPPSPSPLSHEFRRRNSTARLAAEERDRAASGKSRDGYPHPPMVDTHPLMVYTSPAQDGRAVPGKLRDSYTQVPLTMPSTSPSRDNSQSGNVRDGRPSTHPPLPYASPLLSSSSLAADSSNLQRSPFHRSDEMHLQRSDKERRRTEKAAARASPCLAADTRHPPMALPPSPPRISIPPISGLRLSLPESATTSSDGKAPASPMPLTPSQTQPPPVHSLAPLPVPRTQAPPSTARAPASAGPAPRSPTKPLAPAGAPTSSAGASSRAAYDVPMEYVRRVDTSVAMRGSYGGGSPRGASAVSKRMHAPATAMATTPLYA